MSVVWPAVCTLAKSLILNVLCSCNLYFLTWIELLLPINNTVVSATYIVFAGFFLLKIINSLFTSVADH